MGREIRRGEVWGTDVLPQNQSHLQLCVSLVLSLFLSPVSVNSVLGYTEYLR